MIYLTGACTSLTDFRTSIINALTANGWTWNATQQTISKGSVAAKLALNTGSGYGSRISITAGTGVDGSGVLLNPPTPTTSPPNCMIADQFTGVPNFMQSVSWPATYRIFIYTGPDLFVAMLDYNVNYRQYMILGMARSLGVQGVDGGSNVPFLSCTLGDSGSNNQQGVTGTFNYGTNLSIHAAIPWYNGLSGYYGSVNANCYAYVNEPATFHRNGMASPWVTNNYGPNNPGGNYLLTGSASCGGASSETWQTQQRSPNQWNGDAPLSPIRPVILRPSNFSSYGFELPHMRLVRNDNLNDGDFITKGSNKWMVLSTYHKDTTNRMGAVNGIVGTFAFALEYTDQ